MLKRSRLVYGAALAAMLGGGSVAFAQEAAPEADALFTKLDKNSDGKLTKEEVSEEQARFFERLVRLGDKDKDGTLTKDEFQQANKPEEKPNVPLDSIGGGESRGGDARQRFGMLDRNKDGKVTLEELPEQIRERLKPVFDRLGKTELTADDFAKLPAAGGQGGPGGQRPEQGEMFKRFDANGDGKLTKDELPAEARERFAPLFERLGKSELTQEDFAQMGQRLQGGQSNRPGQNAQGRRPEGDRPPLGDPEEMFGRLDANGDGKVTVEEAPERAKQMVNQALRRAGKDANGSLTKEEFVKNLPAPPRGADGQRRPEGDRGPEADRRPEEGRRVDGDRGFQVDRRPEGERRPEGDRVPEGRRPEGERREGDRAPEARRAEGDRRPDGDHPAEGRRPDGERREGDRGPEGRRPEGNRRPEARGPEGRGPEGARRPEGPRGPVLVRKLDKNNDGRISKDEFAKLADLFDELDTNHDGQLDPSELFGGPMGPPRDGEGPRPGDRGPEGIRREVDRRPEASERRLEENDRLEPGGARDGDRPQPPRSDGAKRRPDQPRDGVDQSNRERSPRIENEKSSEPKDN